MRESAAEVLVIGAGPTGLFVAGELARHGVRARIVDQSPEPHTQTRATGVQPAVLEVLHRAGLVDAFLDAGVPVKGLRILDADLGEAFVSTPPLPATPYPFTCSLPQWRTEEILAARLAERGVAVERGVTAAEIAMAEDGARVRCVDASGREELIHAAYLVGAGGAHSPVRGALHEQLEGITYPRRYLVADVRTSGAHDERHLIAVAISPTGMLMIAELPDDRTLLVADLPDGDVPADAPGLTAIRRTLAAHLRQPLAVVDLRWASMYHTHRRLVPRFSEGRCFLAGDAAHLCSPFGGEGMNSGILDGASLAWMLGAVLRRGGRPRLLDGYHHERRAVADQVLASSEAMYDFYYGLVRMAVAGTPLAPPPADPSRQVTSPAMLDLAFPESPLVDAHGAPASGGGPHPGARFPERTRLGGCQHHLLVYGGAPDWNRVEFAARWSRVLEVVDGERICPSERAGVGPAGAVLVRPDGYVGFQAQAWTAAAQDAFEAHFGQQFAPGT